MENTLENKAKFFAHYWNQKVLNFNNSSAIHNHIYEVQGDMDQYMFLELKPLSLITDEDAEEIRKLQFHFPCEVSISFDLTDEFAVCIQSKLNDIYEVVNINSIDYLRSKGYALPWMGLSVETIEKYGWIKLKTD